jgi:hypothetical protein
MVNSDKSSNGFALFEILIAAVLLVVLVLAIHFITHTGDHTKTPLVASATKSSTTSTTNSSNSYATLSPATVPSKTAECSQQLTFSSNGTSGPLTCSSGDLNSLEWDALAALEPSVFKLGYGATAVQVQAALCADVGANVSNPIELTVYQVASLYYGWNFSTNPSNVLTNGSCVNVDD